jgi:hypothetical protein
MKYLVLPVKNKDCPLCGIVSQAQNPFFPVALARHTSLCSCVVSHVSHLFLFSYQKKSFRFRILFYYSQPVRLCLVIKR